jgi:hypothetical protein
MWRSNGFMSPDESGLLADVATWLLVGSIAMLFLAIGFAAGALR